MQPDASGACRTAIRKFAEEPGCETDQMMDSDQEWKRWVLGAVVPIILGFVSVRGILLKTASIYGKHSEYVVYGQEAIVISCSYLAAAVFFHAYFFHENRERSAGYREVIVIISLLCFLATAARFVYLDFRP